MCEAVGARKEGGSTKIQNKWEVHYLHFVQQSKSHSEWLYGMIHLLVHSTVCQTQGQVQKQTALVQNSVMQKFIATT